ncbi:MAG: hypothetical protein PHC78_05450, partial [Verrucomicrobiota bacterium]|nr:hypothetical protein [Verrucomicrobiota bacterium]
MAARLDANGGGSAADGRASLARVDGCLLNPHCCEGAAPSNDADEIRHHCPGAAPGQLLGDVRRGG